MQKIMQKIHIMLLILLMIIFLNNTNSFAMNLYYDGIKHDYIAEGVTLKINGEKVNSEMPPIILNDRTLVPARDVFEKLGATVKWDEKYKQVYVTYANKQIQLAIDDKIVYINQMSAELDVPAKIINNKTMIPVAFIARELGFKVEWDEKIRTVYIGDKGEVVADNNNQPEDNKSKIVLGYTTYYNSKDTASYNSMVDNKKLLDQVVTNTYKVDGLGNIEGLIPIDQIQFAKANNIKIQASISNEFDSKVAQKLLESSINRDRLISNILNEMQKYGYSGVSIDIEHVYPSDRTYMTQFMQELYSKLHPKGYSVTIDLPAKTYDDKTGAWQGAFDYKALAAYADQFVLMAYDEHYPQGTPGPIASAKWVENVVKYATNIIPKEKLLLGIASYGYDWSINGTKAFSTSKAYSVAKAYNAPISWDSGSKASYYEYTDKNGIKHKVWFENEKSIESKLELVNNYELQGVSIWALGYETPEYMTKISTILR